MTTHAQVRFRSGADEIAATIHEPAGAGPHPAVLLGHGFGTTADAGLGRYAERFRDAGIVAITFDYRHFGKSGGEPRQLLSIRRQLQDWHAAISFARSLPSIDAERIALWGTSFSGGHVLRVASRDHRVAAVVSQVPFANGLATTLRLPLLSVLKVGGLAAADLIRSALGGQPVMMPLVGRPGTAAAMALDEAVEGFDRLYGGMPWQNSVCARIGFAVPLYRPGRYAGRVRCPVLFQIGQRDALTPPAPARRAARAAALGEIHEYPHGHFDFYFEGFPETVEAQVAFLTGHLIRRSRSSRVN